MKAFVTVAMAGLTWLAAAPAASAGWGCGAAGYNCCPVASCAPTACYSSCRVERQTCYRTVYDTVYEPEQRTCSRTVYDTVYDNVEKTCYRTVVETAEREVEYQVQRPVVETSYREQSYTVQKPVWETAYRACSYQVRRPVWTDCEREVRHTVMRQHVETIEQERCYTVMRPVTSYRTVRRMTGEWQTRQVYHPGPVVPRWTCDPCGRPRMCMVQCPGFTTCHRQWCPRVVECQVPCTTYQPQVVRQVCPVQVCRVVPEVVCRKVPYRTCNWVTETKTQQVPYRVCRMECETRTCKIPVCTRKMVCETRTCKVPYCVKKQVPYTVCHKVARCVAREEPYTVTRMVARCVPRQVPYEVCRLVPVEVCCTDGACSTSSNCASCGISTPSEISGDGYEANKPADAIPDNGTGTEHEVRKYEPTPADGADEAESAAPAEEEPSLEPTTGGPLFVAPGDAAA